MGKGAWVGMMMVMLAGCATVGNPAIMHVQPEDVKNLTQAQLVEKYGTPSLRQMTVQNGKVTNVYVWSYVSIGPGQAESASFSVSFDEHGAVQTVSTVSP